MKVMKLVIAMEGEFPSCRKASPDNGCLFPAAPDLIKSGRIKKAKRKSCFFYALVNNKKDFFVQEDEKGKKKNDFSKILSPLKTL